MGTERKHPWYRNMLKKVLQKSAVSEEFLTWCSHTYTKLYIATCRTEPQKVVLSSYWGKGYGDNPKYITEEILKQGLDWDIVWMTNGTNMNYPQGVRTVLYGSNDALRELASAKMWVDNVRNSLQPPKKKNQVYLQTWHGGVSFKCVEKAAEKTIHPNYVKAAKRDGQISDGIVCACRIQKEDFQENFWLNPNTEILECGLPRNDIFFDQEWVEQKYREIRRHFGIDQDTKIVLYAPTFRDDYSMDAYRLDFVGILEAMERRFRQKMVLVVRLHPNVQDQADFIEYDDRILNGTTWPDAQELYMAADYMISDYSSSFLDYALLNRPVFLCLPDYEKYRAERGLNEVFEQCPFPRAYSSEQLLEVIGTFSEEKYWADMAAFREKWQPYDDGHAAQTIVAWMKQKMQEG